jgi:hypothetical protein
LRSYLIGWQAKARARSGGVAGFPRGRATTSKEGLGRRGMKVGKIFFEEGCSSELREPRSLMYRVFKFRNGCRKKMVIEFGQLKCLLEHVYGSAGLYHLKTTIKKIIFVATIRRMIRIKTTIGTWMTQRSRLALLSC